MNNIIVHNKQEELRLKEQRKIDGIRGRAKERTIRFMNSQERCIGISKNALDLQVQEKKRNKLIEKQEEKDEGAKILMISLSLKINCKIIFIKNFSLSILDNSFVY